MVTLTTPQAQELLKKVDSKNKNLSNDDVALLQELSRSRDNLDFINQSDSPELQAFRVQFENARIVFEQGKKLKSAVTYAKRINEITESVDKSYRDLLNKVLMRREIRRLLKANANITNDDIIREVKSISETDEPSFALKIKQGLRDKKLIRPKLRVEAAIVDAPKEQESNNVSSENKPPINFDQIMGRLVNQQVVNDLPQLQLPNSTGSVNADAIFTLNNFNQQLEIYKADKNTPPVVMFTVNGVDISPELLLLKNIADYEVEISPTFRWVNSDRKAQVATVKALITNYISALQSDKPISRSRTFLVLGKLRNSITDEKSLLRDKLDSYLLPELKKHGQDMLSFLRNPAGSSLGITIAELRTMTQEEFNHYYSQDDRDKISVALKNILNLSADDPRMGYAGVLVVKLGIGEKGIEDSFVNPNQETYNQKLKLKTSLLKEFDDKMSGLTNLRETRVFSIAGTIGGLLGTHDPKDLLKNEFELLKDLKEYEIEISGLFRKTDSERRNQVSLVRRLAKEYITYFGTPSAASELRLLKNLYSVRESISQKSSSLRNKLDKYVAVKQKQNFERMQAYFANTSDALIALPKSQKEFEIFYGKNNVKNIFDINKIFSYSPAQVNVIKSLGDFIILTETEKTSLQVREEIHDQLEVGNFRTVAENLNKSKANDVYRSKALEALNLYVRSLTFNNIDAIKAFADLMYVFVGLCGKKNTEEVNQLMSASRGKIVDYFAGLLPNEFAQGSVQENLKKHEEVVKALQELANYNAANVFEGISNDVDQKIIIPLIKSYVEYYDIGKKFFYNSDKLLELLNANPPLGVKVFGRTHALTNQFLFIDKLVESYFANTTFERDYHQCKNFKEKIDYISKCQRLINEFNQKNLGKDAKVLLRRLAVFYLSDLVDEWLKNPNESRLSSVLEGKSAVFMEEKEPVAGTSSDLAKILLDKLSSNISIDQKIRIVVLLNGKSIKNHLTLDVTEKLKSYFFALVEAKKDDEITGILQRGYILELDGQKYGTIEQIREWLIEKLSSEGKSQSDNYFLDVMNRPWISSFNKNELIRAYNSLRHGKLMADILEYIGEVNRGNYQRVFTLDVNLAKELGQFITTEQFEQLKKAVASTVDLAPYPYQGLKAFVDLASNPQDDRAPKEIVNFNSVSGLFAEIASKLSPQHFGNYFVSTTEIFNTEAELDKLFDGMIPTRISNKVFAKQLPDVVCLMLARLCSDLFGRQHTQLEASIEQGRKVALMQYISAKIISNFPESTQKTVLQNLAIDQVQSCINKTQPLITIANAKLLKINVDRYFSARPEVPTSSSEIVEYAILASLSGKEVLLRKVIDAVVKDSSLLTDNLLHVLRTINANHPSYGLDQYFGSKCKDIKLVENTNLMKLAQAFVLNKLAKMVEVSQGLWTDSNVRYEELVSLVGGSYENLSNVLSSMPVTQALKEKLEEKFRELDSKVSILKKSQVSTYANQGTAFWSLLGLLSKLPIVNADASLDNNNIVFRLKKNFRKLVAFDKIDRYGMAPAKELFGISLLVIDEKKNASEYENAMKGLYYKYLLELKNNNGKATEKSELAKQMALALARQLGKDEIIIVLSAIAEANRSGKSVITIIESVLAKDEQLDEEKKLEKLEKLEKLSSLASLPEDYKTAYYSLEVSRVLNDMLRKLTDNIRSIIDTNDLMEMRDEFAFDAKVARKDLYLLLECMLQRKDKIDSFTGENDQFKYFADSSVGPDVKPAYDRLDALKEKYPNHYRQLVALLNSMYALRRNPASAGKALTDSLNNVPELLPLLEETTKSTLSGLAEGGLTELNSFNRSFLNKSRTILGKLGLPKATLTDEDKKQLLNQVSTLKITGSKNDKLKLAELMLTYRSRSQDVRAIAESLYKKDELVDAVLPQAFKEIEEIGKDIKRFDELKTENKQALYRLAYYNNFNDKGLSEAINNYFKKNDYAQRYYKMLEQADNSLFEKISRDFSGTYIKLSELKLRDAGIKIKMLLNSPFVYKKVEQFIESNQLIKDAIRQAEQMPNEGMPASAPSTPVNTTPTESPIGTPPGSPTVLKKE